MCLVLGKNSTVKKVSHDKFVYKLLFKEGNNLHSPFRQEPYFINELKTVDKFGLKDGIVNEGLHSYTTLHQARMSAYGGPKVFRCTIPANTPFIIGVADEIVSLGLIVDYEL